MSWIFPNLLPTFFVQAHFPPIPCLVLCHDLKNVSDPALSQTHVVGPHSGSLLTRPPNARYAHIGSPSLVLPHSLVLATHNLLLVRQAPVVVVVLSPAAPLLSSFVHPRWFLLLTQPCESYLISMVDVILYS